MNGVLTDGIGDQAPTRAGAPSSRRGTASLRGVVLMVLGALVAASMVVQGCSSSGRAPLIVSGASTWGPPLQALERAFEAQYPGLDLQVELGGTTRGIREAINGRNDLGAASRALTPEELERVTAFEFAQDGVAIITHAGVGIEGLTTAQLRLIWTGEATSWSAFGGESGADIHVVGKELGHATLEVFSAHIGVPKGEQEVDVRAGDNSAVLISVSRTPGAIGYVSLGEATQNLDQYDVAMLRLDGMEPTVGSIEAGLWPMTRPLSLVVSGAPGEGARTLLDMLGSDRGSDALRASGFVPVRRPDAPLD